MQPIRRTTLAGTRILVAMLVAFAIVLVFPATSAASPVTPAALRVCIDPGHGGGYSGAFYGGIAEKTLNLQIAMRLKSELERRGIQVTLTRTNDSKVFRGGALRTWRWEDSAGAYRYTTWPATNADDRLRLDLQARCDRANATGPDLFVSIHNNAGGSSANGIEVWHAGNDPLGHRFAEDVLTYALAETGASNRGVHDASFYVARWSNTPAVLVECGFMSNATELARLRTASYQQRLAEGIADGIARFAARTVAEPYGRVAGKNRWETAVAVSKRSHPEGSGVVVLASGRDFPDALVAGPLAFSMNAPVLTTETSSLPEPVAAEIARLSPERIVIVGGTAAVDSAVATAAASAAGIAADTVERAAGRTRYETAVAVAQRIHSTEPTAVVVASGVSWADALSIAASASSRGEPILLTPPTGLPTATSEYLAGLGSHLAVTVVGGVSVVPDNVLVGLTYTRLAGADRYETNWAVLEDRYGLARTSSAFIASGEVYADALVVGPLAAALSRPVILVGKSRVPQDLRSWVYANQDIPLGFTIAGGPPAVSAYIGPSHEKWRMNDH